MTHSRTPVSATLALSLFATPVLAAEPALAAEPPGTSESGQAPLATTSNAGAAALDGADAVRSGGRELGGHLFMPPVGFVGPFAATSFGTFLTVGAGSTEGSISLQIPGTSVGQTFQGNVSYAAVGGILGYEYAFLRDFALRVGLSESIYSGTTGTSVAIVGSNARLGGDVGITGGITIGDSLRVSGVFDASYTPRLGLLIGPAIQAAFDSCTTGASDCNFDFGKLFEQQNILTLTPGVAAAWAPLKALGLTGNVSYSHLGIDTKGGSSVSEGALSIGTAVDFDFQGISRAPVGLQFIWNNQWSLSHDKDSAYTDLGGGLFYTGREDLSLGLQMLRRRFRVVPEVDVSWSTLLALVGLRYYWQ